MFKLLLTHPRNLDKIDGVAKGHWADLSNATHPGWTTKRRATGGMVTFQIDLL